MTFTTQQKLALDAQAEAEVELAAYEAEAELAQVHEESIGNTDPPPAPAGERRPPSTIAVAELQPEPQQQQQPVRRAPGRRFTVVPMERSDGTPKVTSPYLANRDEDILKRTIQDCGLHAYGAIFLEVWVLSSNGKYLRRPIGGHWMDPQFIHSFSSPELPQQVEKFAPDCVPGASLAGTLYSETSRWGHWGNRQVYWRQVKSMAEDPFIQDDGRMKRIYEDLGIGFVATVPFYYQGRKGIVLFMNRTSCNVDNLRSTANENFLIAAADLIGAAFAIRIPRQELSDIRRDVFQRAEIKTLPG